MNTEELRILQAPLKEEYKETPTAALVTLKAEGRVGLSPTSCEYHE